MLVMCKNTTCRKLIRINLVFHIEGHHQQSIQDYINKLFQSCETTTCNSSNGVVSHRQKNHSSTIVNNCKKPTVSTSSRKRGAEMRKIQQTSVLESGENDKWGWNASQSTVCLYPNTGNSQTEMEECNFPNDINMSSVSSTYGTLNLENSLSEGTNNVNGSFLTQQSILTSCSSSQFSYTNEAFATQSSISLSQSNIPTKSPVNACLVQYTHLFHSEGNVLFPPGKRVFEERTSDPHSLDNEASESSSFQDGFHSPRNENDSSHTSEVTRHGAYSYSLLTHSYNYWVTPATQAFPPEQERVQSMYDESTSFDSKIDSHEQVNGIGTSSFPSENEQCVDGAIPEGNYYPANFSQEMYSFTPNYDAFCQRKSAPYTPYTCSVSDISEEDLFSNKYENISDAYDEEEDDAWLHSPASLTCACPKISTNWFRNSKYNLVSFVSPSSRLKKVIMEPVDENNVDENNVDESNVDESNVNESNVDENNVDENHVDENHVDENNGDENNVDESNACENNMTSIGTPLESECDRLSNPFPSVSPSCARQENGPGVSTENFSDIESSINSGQFKPQSNQTEEIFQQAGPSTQPTDYELETNFFPNSYESTKNEVKTNFSPNSNESTENNNDILNSSASATFMESQAEKPCNLDTSDDSVLDKKILLLRNTFRIPKPQKLFSSFGKDVLRNNTLRNNTLRNNTLRNETLRKVSLTNSGVEDPSY